MIALAHFFSLQASSGARADLRRSNSGGEGGGEVLGGRIEMMMMMMMGKHRLECLVLIICFMITLTFGLPQRMPQSTQSKQKDISMEEWDDNQVKVVINGLNSVKKEEMIEDQNASRPSGPRTPS